MYKFCFLLLILILCFNKSYEHNCNYTRPVLVVISLDGFKNDYFDRKLTPNLSLFRKNAVYDDLISTYLSNAYQAHHTIATGYHSATHGVMGHKSWSINITNDVETVYEYGEQLYSYNKTITPIWAYNQLYGGSSACSMWPGCEFGKNKVAYLEPYNKATSMQKRFEKVVEWLKISPGGPNLIMVYIEEPDRTGHKYGPNSREVNKVLAQIDRSQGYFHEKLNELNLAETVNVVYVSDHGMEEVNHKNFISEKELLNDCGHPKKSSIFLSSVQIGLTRGVDEKYKATCAPYMLTHYDHIDEKEEKNRDRQTNPIFAVRPYGAWSEYMKKYIDKKRKVNANTKFGSHGYKDHRDAIFMAQGPFFVAGKIDTEIRMVDLFQMFTRILQLPNDDRDGYYPNIAPMLVIANQCNLPLTLLLIFICGVIHCTIYTLLLTKFME